MSVEDETFDIDLYGDEDDTVENEQYVQSQPSAASAPKTDDVTESQHDGSLSDTAVLRGMKRKASLTGPREHDEETLQHGAQNSLRLAELQWWITEEDLRAFCERAKVEAELVDIAFGEHKINGKSRGEAYLEFRTPQAAGKVKKEIEESNTKLDSAKTTTTKISVWYVSPGNPFRVREGSSKKETPSNSKYNQQGAYNNYNTNPNRGSYSGGRGRGGYNARGGGQWNNTAAGFNNNVMNSFGNTGFAGFPAMNVNQNAMMSAMMAGNFMGMPNMMTARGGGNMMNRGGWNQRNQGQHGYNAGWDSNKKPRTD